MRSLLVALVATLAACAHGAPPTTFAAVAASSAAVEDHDAFAELVLRLAPEAKQILVLGASAGLLERDLRAHGVTVDVLDDRGFAAVVEGKRAEPRLHGPYDAVLIDAALRDVHLPIHGPESLANLPVVPGVVLASRARFEVPPWAEDADIPSLTLQLTTEGRDGLWDHVTLFRETGDRLDGAGLKEWPIQQTMRIAKGQPGATKRARFFGYLVRTPEGARLELPHDRLGAVDVDLHGPVAARELFPRAPEGDRKLFQLAETRGAAALVSDGMRTWPERTLTPSTTLVAVHGQGRFLGRDDVGLHYDLEVESVERVLDPEAIAPIEARQIAHLEAARVPVLRGDFAGAQVELEAAKRDLETALGEDVKATAWHRATEDLAGIFAMLALDSIANCRAFWGYSQRLGHRHRPYAHPADVALYAAVKQRLDPQARALWRRKGDTKEIRDAGQCWLNMTDRATTSREMVELMVRFRGGGDEFFLAGISH